MTITAPISAATLDGKTVTERRAHALTIYETACNMPDLADWQSIADALASVLPKAKASKAAPASDGEWHEYGPGKLRQRGDKFFPGRMAEFTFDDGERVRVNLLHHCKEDKPDWPRAARFACVVWRSAVSRRLGRLSDTYGRDFAPLMDDIAAPDIVRAVDLHRRVGASPSACNAASAEHRKPQGDWRETWSLITDFALSNGGDWKSAILQWRDDLHAAVIERMYQFAVDAGAPDFRAPRRRPGIARLMGSTVSTPRFNGFKRAA